MTTNIIKTIGELVKELRELKGWSAYRLSKISKIPYSTLSSLEKGSTSPNFETVEKLAKALGVSLEIFATEIRNKNK